MQTTCNDFLLNFKFIYLLQNVQFTKIDKIWFAINYELILPVRLEPTAYFILVLRGACLAKKANQVMSWEWKEFFCFSFYFFYTLRYTNFFCVFFLAN